MRKNANKLDSIPSGLCAFFPVLLCFLMVVDDPKANRESMFDVIFYLDG